jgi:uncharacterized protein YjiS (DUF1127 family)
MSFALCRILSLLRAWRNRMNERALLARLDDRALRDIGITRTDVVRECAKPCWRR